MDIGLVCACVCASRLTIVDVARRWASRPRRQPRTSHKCVTASSASGIIVCASPWTARAEDQADLSSVINTHSSKLQVARRRGGRAQAPQHARRMSVAVFDSIQAALSADSKLGPKVGGSLQFLLTGGHGGDSTWVVDCKQSKVSRGAGKADCTVTLSEENFMALASGKLQGMQAFMAGKMKIKGNMSLAQKVGLLF